MLEVNGLPNTNKTHSVVPYTKNFNVSFSEHKPKILLLYGSLRARSYSKLVIEESARLLTYFGAEVKIFNPEGLPQTDSEDESHPKVQELRDLMLCRWLSFIYRIKGIAVYFCKLSFI